MKWNESIKNCDNIFYNTSIKEINLSNFDSSEITSMEYMFHNWEKLINFNLINSNFSILISMKGIFKNCIYLFDLTF